VDLIISILSNNLSVLVIKGALNGNDLLLLINNDSVIVLEELVPSGIGFVSISISSSDVHRSVLGVD
jgi:hypothetical protein